MKTLIIRKGKNVSMHDVWAVAHHEVEVVLGESIKEKILAARNVVEDAIKRGEPTYGLTTGFGEFQNKFIDKADAVELQKNLITSHCVGVGPSFSTEEVRGAMFCRLLANSQGHSGIRLEVLERIVFYLNEDIVPVVPSKGSVGASGDLAPLSHFVLTLMGGGEVFFRKERMPAIDALKKLNLEPIQLVEKEGLGLNNGTSFMTSVSALSLVKAICLVKVADIAGVLALEAVEGFLDAFDTKVHELRPHAGQLVTANNFHKLVNGSTIVDYNKQRAMNDPLKKVQDSYSIRCIPQVHGAVKDVIRHCQTIIEIEINSVTDNPLVFPEDGDVKSCGNFHGEPIALAMDYLAIALTDLGNMSDRRSYKMLTKALSCGLPGCLVDEDGKIKPGLNSGLMIAQYTTASLCRENQVLAHPASAGNIPTSSGQEDHVSFGSISANKCREVIENLAHILAIELLCGFQGVHLRKKVIKKHGQNTEIFQGEGSRLACEMILGAGVDQIGKDRIFHDDMMRIYGLVISGKLVSELETRGIELAY